MKYKYKFSVIMSIYNVEEYLEEAIKSIVNQTIGFEKNIQMILVNDGSPDNSEEICLKYKKMYPKNIVYIKKKNGGLASAKNKGLKYVEGEYVNFCDADDFVSLNAFKEVSNYLSRNNRLIDFVTIPLYFFGSKEGLHPKYEYMGKTDRIIDLKKEPYNFVLSGAASFYKSSIFESFKFDESFSVEEDTLLNGLLYLKNPQFGYICEKDVKYNYRKRETGNSIVDKSKDDEKSYLTVIKLLKRIISENDSIPRYQQEMIIYELRSRIKQINEDIFIRKQDYENTLYNFKKYINKIDLSYLLYDSKFCSSNNLKYLFTTWGNKDKNSFYDYLFNNSDLKILNSEVISNELQITVSFHNYGNKNMDIVALSGDNIIYPAEKRDFNSPFNERYNVFELDNTHTRMFNFKLDSYRLINFVFINLSSQYCYAPNKVRLLPRNQFDSYNRCIFTDNYKIVFKKRKIRISKINNRKHEYIKTNIRTILGILKNRKKIVLTRLFKRGKPKYILINDRLDKAGDNGEALFKYIYNNEKEISKNTYFVISNKNNDFKKLKRIGKVVKNGSLKHKILFLNAAYIFSSHTMPTFYNAYNPQDLYLFRDLFEYKFVWLQHGITKDDISREANRYLKKIDYVISATKGEYNEFCQDKYCYNKEQILLTGFSRFDDLKNNNLNIITLAPTWRRGFGITKPDYDGFVESDYYKNYSSLLSNKKLINLLMNNNIKLNFVMHPEMENYVDLFKQFESEVIIINNSKSVNYSEIFAESKLLITDYSSIFFDFAYLKKPEIFFQFDKETFFSSHYKKGYFDYKKDAFGDVLINSRDVVDKIEYYIAQDFKIEKKYLNRINKTFAYVDKNNSKRILELTMKGKKHKS